MKISNFLLIFVSVSMAIFFISIISEDSLDPDEMFQASITEPVSKHSMLRPKNFKAECIVREYEHYNGRSKTPTRAIKDYCEAKTTIWQPGDQP